MSGADRLTACRCISELCPAAQDTPASAFIPAGAASPSSAFAPAPAPSDESAAAPSAVIWQELSHKERQQLIEEPDHFTQLPLSIWHRAYFDPRLQGDNVLSSVFLLAGSAACGAILVLLVRGGFRRRAAASGLPARSVLEREIAYGSILASMPRWRMVTFFAAALTVLWALSEALLLLATATHHVPVYFSGGLRLAVVSSPEDRNLVAAAPSDMSPCQRVEWTAGPKGEGVEADLVIERCIVQQDTTPADERFYDTAVSDFQDTNSDDSTVVVLLASRSPQLELGDQSMVTLVPGYRPSSVIFRTNMYRPSLNDSGVGLIGVLELLQLKAIEVYLKSAFEEYGCRYNDSAVIFDIDEQYVLYYAHCPKEMRNQLGGLPGVMQSMFAEHVDVAGEQDRTLKSCLVAYEGLEDAVELYQGNKIKVGKATVPWMNLPACAIFGVVGAVVYLLLSHLPTFDSAEALLQRYDDALLLFEQQQEQFSHQMQKLEDLEAAKGNSSGAGNQNAPHTPQPSAPLAPPPPPPPQLRQLPQPPQQAEQLPMPPPQAQQYAASQFCSSFREQLAQVQGTPMASWQPAPTKHQPSTQQRPVQPASGGAPSMQRENTPL